jgi:alkanesulfonate monooxygenase SsuD/methylene tetrahydromethanopterin reductase-like flavin-dependent oxidoreductase (luciferase family)
MVHMYQDMNVGLFQLLPPADDDRASIEEALREVELAEELGYDSVWLAEHHFGGIGMIGAPSVYAAAIAQRTTRIRIGYGVAVVPLHQPLRLAEEISWVDHLSGGRIIVGFGAGFDERDFAGFGVPLGERHERLREGIGVIRRALTDGTVRPRPLTRPHPPFYRAAASAESMREAIADGMPVLFGTKPLKELRASLELYRSLGGNVAEAYVLRKSPADFDELHALGVRNVIAWYERPLTAFSAPPAYASAPR